MTDAELAQLTNLQYKWEEGSQLITQMRNKNDSIVRVVRWKDRYAVLRYFTIAGKWEVSCDVQNAKPDEAFITLGRVMG